MNKIVEISHLELLYNEDIKRVLTLILREFLITNPLQTPKGEGRNLIIMYKAHYDELLETNIRLGNVIKKMETISSNSDGQIVESDRESDREVK